MEICIKSEFLQLAEPLMAEYFDYDSEMLFDEINYFVEESGLDLFSLYKMNENKVLIVDHDKIFREHKDLGGTVITPYKKIQECFSKYFDETTGEENFKVFLCLTYMSYIYHKTKNNLFIYGYLFEALDFEYNTVLYNQIYPEMLSLYKMILESKTKRKRGSKITITYKQDKIDVNTCAWFLDDLEKYFRDRFPDLTLEKINDLLPPSDKKGKAGKKFTNRITNNLIWGTYQLLRNHHSYFKNLPTKAGNEICQFIINYLNYLEISNDFTETDIRGWLKDMIKRGYKPQWDTIFRNAFSVVIKEKENLLNQSYHRHGLSYLVHN